MAVAAGNRKDQELDIILMSTKDGKVIDNLTSGFNKDKGFEYIRDAGRVPQQRGAVDVVGVRQAIASPTSPAPRSHKTLHPAERRHRKIEQRIELKTVDLPESPDISPDGKEVAFSALSGALGDIFIVNVETGELRNVTNDQFGDYAPTWAPDGKSLIYLARVSGNDKLFRLRPRERQEDADHLRHARRRRRAVHRRDTIVFPSTATRSESAHRSRDRAQRQHLQHLDAQPEERRAEAVHRYADRERLPDRPAGREGRREDRVRHLLQG